MIEMRFTSTKELNLKKTFECGQCFRWNADERGIYTGIAFGQAAQLRQDGDDVFIRIPAAEKVSLWHNYFDLDRDYTKINSQFNISGFMKRAVQYGSGIRILRQEPWEVLCSFIISQNNHIPRIKSIIRTMCKMFGEPLNFDGTVLYTFPSADMVSVLNENDLAPIRCGYRAKYIISAAQAVSGGSVVLSALSDIPLETAKKTLTQINGVGNKVADCTLLFGLNYLDAFPVDVWIKKALNKNFQPGFDPKCFSPFAGLAQQYIFYYIRSFSQ